MISSGHVGCDVVGVVVSAKCFSLLKKKQHKMCVELLNIQDKILISYVRITRIQNKTKKSTVTSFHALFSR